MQYFFPCAVIQAAFKMKDTTYILTHSGTNAEFGDFAVKFIGEVDGNDEGFWLCTWEMYVHKYPERR